MISIFVTGSAVRTSLSALECTVLYAFFASSQEEIQRQHGGFESNEPDAHRRREIQKGKRGTVVEV